MILRLKNGEISVLLLHMAMNRQGARNVFKKNKNPKELLASFDEIKYTLELIIDKAKEDEWQLENDMHFNINEIRLLQSFLSSYIPLLFKTLKKAGNTLNEDKEQVEILKLIENKTRKMLEGVPGV